MILIVGASGRLGSVLAHKLLDEGKTVRCLTRTPEKLTDLKNKGAEIFQGDLRNPNSLTLACQGVNTVIATAHSLLGRGKERSELVDYQGHLDLINAANNANVNYFIYISVLFANAETTVPFAQYKYKIEQYLKSSGLVHTIFRPSAFIEEHAQEMIGKPMIEKGKVTIFGRGESLINYVSVEDVAKFVLLGISDQKLHGKTITVGGPDNLTSKQVVKLYEKAIGLKAKVTHVPVFVMKVMSPLLRPFHQGLSQVMALSIHLDSYGGVFDMKETLQEFPTNMISLEKWIEGQQFNKRN
jgi:NADH dehydrogenase